MSRTYHKGLSTKPISRRDFFIMAGTAGALGVPLIRRFIASARKKRLQRIWDCQ